MSRNKVMLSSTISGGVGGIAAGFLGWLSLYLSIEHPAVTHNFIWLLLTLIESSIGVGVSGLVIGLLISLFVSPPKINRFLGLSIGVTVGLSRPLCAYTFAALTPTINPFTTSKIIDFAIVILSYGIGGFVGGLFFEKISKSQKLQSLNLFKNETL